MAFEQAIKPPSRALRTAGTVAGELAAIKLLSPLPGPGDDILVGASRLIRAVKKSAIVAAGGVAGEAVQIAIDPDREFNEAELKHLAGVGVAEFGLEAGTLGAGRIGRRLLGGTIELVPGVPAMNNALESEARLLGLKGNVRLLPGQVSPNAFVDTIQGLTENSIVGSNQFRKYVARQAKAATSLVEELPNLVADGAKLRSPGAMRDLLADVVQSRGIAHRAAASHLYKGIDVATAGAKVDATPILGAVDENLRRFAASGDAGVSTELRSGLEKIQKVIVNNDGKLSWEAAHDMQSGFLDNVRRGQSALTPDRKMVAVNSKLQKVILGTMHDTAKELGVDEQFVAARRFFADGIRTFENKTIRSLVKRIDDPSLAMIDMTSAIFKDPELITKVRTAVGDKEFKKVRGAWLRDIIKKSRGKADPETLTGEGPLLGTKILDHFNAATEEGLLAAGFSSVEKATIRNNARTLALIQARTGGQAGALRFVQGQAAAAIVVGPLVGGEIGKEAVKSGGVIMIGPAVLGKLLAWKPFNRLLTDSMKAPPGSQQSVALTARLIRNVLQTRKEINAERAKARTVRFKEEIKAPPAQQEQAFRGGSFR